MITNQFKDRLLDALNNFDLQKAEDLCVDIHDAECSGYEVSNSEDRLWQKLTDKIQNRYNN